MNNITTVGGLFEMLLKLDDDLPTKFSVRLNGDTHEIGSVSCRKAFSRTAAGTQWHLAISADLDAEKLYKECDELIARLKDA